jgi:hypothetical protein
MMIYREPQPAGRDDLLDAVREGNAEEIAESLLGLTTNDPDWRWVQDRCLALLRHPSTDVRAIAVTCLGHLARTHRQLDSAKVVAELQTLQSDDELAGRIQDALEDIAQYVQ